MQKGAGSGMRWPHTTAETGRVKGKLWPEASAAGYVAAISMRTWLVACAVTLARYVVLPPVHVEGRAACVGPHTAETGRVKGKLWFEASAAGYVAAISMRTWLVACAVTLARSYCSSVKVNRTWPRIGLAPEPR